MESADIAQLAHLLENSYCSYSQIRVSSIVECKDVTRQTGVNVENASYTLTACAESAAIFAAVAAGMKKGYVKKIFIYSDSVPTITPCGACRQIMSEFSNEDTRIYTCTKNGKVCEHSISQLLPFSFPLQSRESQQCTKH